MNKIFKLAKNIKTRQYSNDCLPWINNIVLRPNDINKVPIKCKNKNFYMNVIKNVPEKQIGIIAKDISKDTLDNEILDKMISRTHSDFQSVIYWDEYSIFKYVQNNRTSYELYMKAIAANPINIRYIPKDLLSKEMCVRAVHMYANAIEHVPDKFKDYEMCRYAVNDSGYLIRSVPREFMTEELCELAMTNKSICALLRHIPEEYRTRAICELAMDRDGMNLEHVPREHKDKELCTMAISRNGKAIYFTPIMHIDKDMCILAMKNHRYTYQHIPDEFKYDIDLIRYAIGKCGEMIEFVPRKMLNLELCELSLNERTDTYRRAFRFIPDEYKTMGMCEKAVDYYGPYIEYVPRIFMSEELCLRALKYGYDTLKSIPDMYVNKEMCLEAFKYAGKSLFKFKHIPEIFRDREVYYLAIKNEVNGINIGEMPMEFMDEEMIRVIACTRYLGDLSEKYMNEELCLLAMKNGVSLEYVPIKFRNYDVCMEYCKNHTDMSHIPLDLRDNVNIKKQMSETIEKKHHDAWNTY